MTHDEVQAVKQRTRDEWDKYQKSRVPGRIVLAIPSDTAHEKRDEKTIID